MENLEKMIIGNQDSKNEADPSERQNIVELAEEALSVSDKELAQEMKMDALKEFHGKEEGFLARLRKKTETGLGKAVKNFVVYSTIFWSTFGSASAIALEKKINLDNSITTLELLDNNNDLSSDKMMHMIIGLEGSIAQAMDEMNGNDSDENVHQEKMTDYLNLTEGGDMHRLAMEKVQANLGEILGPEFSSDQISASLDVDDEGRMRMQLSLAELPSELQHLQKGLDKPIGESGVSLSENFSQDDIEKAVSHATVLALADLVQDLTDSGLEIAYTTDVEDLRNLDR
jgi:hypothetical protein